MSSHYIPFAVNGNPTNGQVVSYDDSIQQAKWTTPASPVTLLNLNGVLFVDGNTTATSPNGNIESPFTTLAEGLAAFDPANGGVVYLTPFDYSTETIIIEDDTKIQGLGDKNSIVTARVGPLTVNNDLICVNLDLASGAVAPIVINNASIELINCVLGNPINVGAAADAVARIESTRVGNDVDFTGGDVTEIRFLNCTFQGGITIVADDIISDGFSAAAALIAGINISGWLVYNKLGAVQSITGTTEQEQIDSIVAALVAVGVATDDR